MKKYSFSLDSIQRRPLNPKEVKDGDIVAFEWYKDDEESPKKGVACMGGNSTFYAAYNLYRDANDADGVWIDDELPDDIILFPPTKEEYKLAIEKFEDCCIEYINYTDPRIYPNNTSLSNVIDLFIDTYNTQQELSLYTITRLKAQLKKRDDAISKLISENTNNNFNKQELIDAEKQIDELKATIEDLNNKSSEDEFVKRLVRETKNLYKHEKEKIEVIRQILYKLGRTDAEAELDALIESKEKPLVKIEKAADVIADGGKKVIKNINEAV